MGLLTSLSLPFLAQLHYQRHVHIAEALLLKHTLERGLDADLVDTYRVLLQIWKVTIGETVDSQPMIATEGEGNMRRSLSRCSK
eukprot:scaffold10663_cov203-Skeletonema_menzelii.AAC.2